MNFRKLCAVALLALCGVGMLASSVLAGDAKGTALIHQFYAGGDAWTRGLLVQAATIDGKKRGALFGKPVKAPAGLHIVGVRVEFQVKPKNVLFEPTNKYRDIFEFPVKLEAGRSYTAMGRQSGPHVEIWIMETESRKLISKVIDITVPTCRLFKGCPHATITERSAL